MRRIIIVILFLVCGTALGQSTENMSPEKSYQALLQEENNINGEIQSLTATLSSLRGGKAKKAVKRLDELVAKQEAIRRTMMFYPESVKNRQVQPKIDDQAREQVRRMVEESVLAKGGYVDDFQNQTNEQQSHGEYWSIALAISSNPDVSKYQQYGNVEVENMAGRYIFFLGRYSTKSEADSKCKQIVKKGKLRDAFVIKRNK